MSSILVGVQNAHGQAETRAHLEARDGHSAKLREYANRVREAGNTDTAEFPSDEEMMAKAREAREAANA